MGLPDDYILPHNYNEACHLTGDGVVVPEVRFLADALIEPRGLAQSRRGEADSPGNKPTSSTSPLFWHQVAREGRRLHLNRESTLWATGRLKPQQSPQIAPGSSPT